MPIYEIHKFGENQFAHVEVDNVGVLHDWSFYRGWVNIGPGDNGHKNGEWFATRQDAIKGLMAANFGPLGDMYFDQFNNRPYTVVARLEFFNIDPADDSII